VQFATFWRVWLPPSGLADRVLCHFYPSTSASGLTVADAVSSLFFFLLLSAYILFPIRI
jgi:hypothetical protein